MHIVIIPVVIIWTYIYRYWQAAKARRIASKDEPIIIDATS